MVPIASYPSEPLAAPLAALLARRPELDPEVEDAVRDILRQVRKEGDAALCALTQRFDGVEVCPKQVRYQRLCSPRPRPRSTRTCALRWRRR